MTQNVPIVAQNRGSTIAESSVTAPRFGGVSASSALPGFAPSNVMSELWKVQCKEGETIMGKKGELLRQQKKQTAVYTFTAEQLASHDQAVVNARKELIMADMQKQADAINAQNQEYIRQEWETREKLFSSKGFDNNLVEIIALLISISARILVEDFGWQPLPKDGNYRKSRKLYRFSEAVAKRIMDICADENADIRSFNDETYELYGIRFTAEEVD